VSSLTLLGMPGEIYTFGTVIMYGFLFKPIGVVIGTTLFLPVLGKIGGLSLYKVRFRLYTTNLLAFQTEL